MKKKLKPLDLLIIAAVLVGYGWAGNNDYEYRQGQAVKHLAVLHAANK